MKRIILTTLIIGLISLSCHAQVKSNLKAAETNLLPSINSVHLNFKPLDFKANLQSNKSFNVENYLKVPELKIPKSYDFKNNLVLIDTQHNCDNMPCLKPKITSRIPVHLPDSSTNYTLLIKKIR